MGIFDILRQERTQISNLETEELEVPLPPGIDAPKSEMMQAEKETDSLDVPIPEKDKKTRKQARIHRKINNKKIPLDTKEKPEKAKDTEKKMQSQTQLQKLTMEMQRITEELKKLDKGKIR